MLDSRKTNPKCSFAEEVIAYIYDEMKPGKKQEFEQHLSTCPLCENELTAFSAVSTSVKEWRDFEFSGLETPKIEIPYPTASKMRVATVVAEDSNTWLESIRAFFASFGMATVLGCISLVFVLGLSAFLIHSFSTGGDVADVPSKESIKPIDRTGDKNTAKPKTDELVKENESDSDSPADLVEPTPEVAVDNSSIRSSQKRVARKADYKRTAVKNRKPTRKNIKKKRSPSKRLKSPNNVKEAPVIQAPIDRLTEEFAIDERKEDELRLTDLFDEVGSDR